MRARRWVGLVVSFSIGMLGLPGSVSVASAAAPSQSVVVAADGEDDIPGLPPTDPPPDVPGNDIPSTPTPPDPAVVDDTSGDPIPPPPDLPAGEGEVTPTTHLTAVEDLPILVGPTDTDTAPPLAAGARTTALDATDPVTWDVGVDATADATIDTVPDALVISLSTDDLQAQALSGLRLGSMPSALDPLDEGDASTRVVLDYSDFAGLWGGGWADRLIVQVMPDCYTTTPELPECQSPVGVEDQTNNTENDRLSWQMVTDIAAPAPLANSAAAAALSGGGSTSTFVVSAGASGSSGSYSATPTAGSTQWQVGPGTGAFNYAYPMGAPPGPAGNAPDVQLRYSSSAVDGMTASENNQGGVAGVGWDLQAAYIERHYTPCSDDGQGWADWCWLTQGGAVMEDASIVLNGHAAELVEMPDQPGSFRLADDPGWRVTLDTNPATITNDDNNDEFWKVETPDGSVYWFGYGHASGDATNSVWTAPVFGNNAGEPCNAQWPSSCQQGYRWNLDKSVDPNGNVTIYRYDTEDNRYGMKGQPSGTKGLYTRAGWLTTIEYGMDNNGSGPTATVTFNMNRRCKSLINNPNGPSCDTAQNTPGDYPDVPADLICNSGAATCGATVPTFFTTNRLDSVTTRTSDAGGPHVVDKWQLRYTMPDPDGAGGDDPMLWLDTIQRTGTDDSGSLDMPVVDFEGQWLNNRVDTSVSASALQKMRVITIRTETGGVATVDYGHVNACTAANVPAKGGPRQTKECFGQYYDPDGPGGAAPKFGWFHVWLVQKLTLSDTAMGIPITGATPAINEGRRRVTTYDYNGGVGWRSADSRSNKTDQDAGNRYWSNWRGYQTSVVHTKSVTQTGTVNGEIGAVRYTMFRGLNNDWAANTASANRVTGIGVPVDEGSQSQLTDWQWYAGRAAEIEHLNAGGTVKDRAVHIFKSYVTANPPDVGNSIGHGAKLQVEPTTITRTFLSDGTNRAREIDRTFAGESAPRIVTAGMPTEVLDQGQLSITADTVCTSTGYYANPTAWIARPNLTTTYDGTCSAGTVAAKQRLSYDSMPRGAGSDTDLIRGNVTGTRTWTDTNAQGQTTTYIDTSARYDSMGRQIGVYLDCDEQAPSSTCQRGTTTDYNPNGVQFGPLKTIKVTTPRNWTTTTAVDPRRFQPTTVTDLNGNVTTLGYDPLGRLTGVWLPGNATGRASVAYDYTVRTTNPSIVHTATLRNRNGSGTSDDTVDDSYTYLDGWGRTVETQSEQPDGSGRVVTATGYDDQGLPWFQTDPFSNPDGPGTSLVNPNLDNVATYAETLYDWAGRPTSVETLSDTSSLFTTGYEYTGSDVKMTPPVGGKTVSHYDIRGHLRTVEQKNLADATVVEGIYAYTATGLLETVTDAMNNTITYEYDLMGRRTKATDPDTGVTNYDYDDFGNQTVVDDAAVGRVKTDYDNADRPSSVYEQEQNNSNVWVTTADLIDYTYDTLPSELGQLSSETSHTAVGDLTHSIQSYDAEYRPTSEKWQWPAGLAGNTSATQAYTYNDAGMLSTATYPVAGDSTSGFIGDIGTDHVSLNYVHGGYLSQMSVGLDIWDSAPNATVADVSYDSLGRPTTVKSMASATNMVRDYSYETDTGRLASIEAHPSAVGSADWVNMRYLYDKAANPTTVIFAGAQTATCYTYDPLGRLTDAKTRNLVDPSVDPSRCGSSMSSVVQRYDQSFTYDPSGNLTKLVNRNVAATGDPSTAWTADYAYPAPNNAAGLGAHAVKSVTGTGSPSVGDYTYTNGGWLSQWDGPGSRQAATTYTPFGRPETAKLWNTATTPRTQLSTTTYAYWPDGSRAVTQSTSASLPNTTTNTVDAGATTYTTQTVSGVRQPTAATRAYVTPDGRLVAQRTSSKGWVWLLGDAQGSVRASLRSSTGTVRTTTYLPYGQPTSAGAPDTVSARGYLGKVHPSVGAGAGTVTGSNPDGGSHASTAQAPGDTVAADNRDYASTLARFTTPDPLMDLADPQTINPYSYSDDNPISRSDPSGLMNACVEGCVSEAESAYFLDDPVVSAAQVAKDRTFVMTGHTQQEVEQAGDVSLVGATATIASFAFKTAVFDPGSCGSVGLSCGVEIAGIIPIGKPLKALKYAADAADAARGVERAEGAANSVRPAVTDARLGRALADDFRGGPSPIGDGSALDAARHTVDTGELVGGSTHLEKAVEMRDRYARILRRGGLSSADQAVAQGRYDAYSSFVIENDLDAMMRARGLR